MSLPKPQLDDKTFAQLMEDVTKLIPRYAPEWTDFNKHDPGITFLELFAALTEQQRYYLDRIQDSSLQKFLKLLGIQPKEFTAARVEVRFSHRENHQPETSLLIPNGTKLSFSSSDPEKTIFETEADLWVVPTTLKQVISFSRFEVKDNTGANDNPGLSFAAFGDGAENDSRLYLGFDRPFPAGKPIGMTFDLVESVERGSHGDEAIKIVLSVQLRWEYSADGDRWKTLEIIKDETLQLTQSGQLWFTTPSDMERRELIPFPGAFYWIRAIIVQDGYEIPPQVNIIHLNAIAATQQDTRAKVITFSSNGQLRQVFPAPYLALVGETILQICVDEGIWQDCIDSRVCVDRETRQMTFEFAQTERPPVRDRIRLICYAPSFQEPFQLRRSNGLPNQSFQIAPLVTVTNSFALQVEIQEDIWQDWLQVQDFDASQPEDRHYILDSQTGVIFFGDGVNGQIPLAAAAIRIISYQTSQAEKGNVKAEANIQFLESPLPELESLSASNPQAAIGGTRAESIEQAQLRARKQLRTTFRAVTSEDFEKLALETPGLQVARAKAIPSLQKPHKAPLVNVVVVPYSPREQPIPSQGFLQTVKAHLDRHRLITTQIEVTSPIYVGIRVVTTVRKKTGFTETVTRQSIENKLNQFLAPLSNRVSEQGWEFGRTVYKSEIYAAIESVDAVDCVQSVTLDFEGATAVRDRKDNIQLTSARCLVYALKHNITVIKAETSERLQGGRKI